MPRRKSRLFIPIFAMVLLADCGTKRLAVEHLEPHVPHEVLGDVVRFTLGYNPGAAFGITVGDASRWIFTALGLVALAMLTWLYRTTRPGDRIRTLAFALVLGGAVGNLFDRLRSARGVVDFIDVGLGDARWWTFNVADAGITTGALLLAWSFWRADRDRQVTAAHEPDRAEPPTDRPPRVT